MIAQFIGQRGISPTFSELRTKLGISSNQSLIDRIVPLERKGLVVRSPKQHRSIFLGPRATEYFRSLGGYITSPVSSIGFSQTSGTFDGQLSAVAGFADGGSFTGGTAATIASSEM